MKLNREIAILRSLLRLTQTELAKELDVSFETVNRWENGKHEAEEENAEKVYAYAFRKGIRLNEIYEQFFKEEEKEGTRILFHGSKGEITFPLDLEHSRKNNDFGPGFYMGESLKQAAAYIANSSSHRVYVFQVRLRSLRAVSFRVDREWMLAIAYFRGWIPEYAEKPILRDIIAKVEESDIVIAPIADNRMFDIISEFVRGEITDAQCEHALAATNLGMQIVARTEKALDAIEFVNLCYLSKPEKEATLTERLKMHALSQDKGKAARIEYRGKGRYIDELFL
ncbi:MAG: DUF3990 domain-containing protein [Bacillales bacterium]|nr:DUF3990 domain-containing protein [Bacillales bacterium]MDY5919509.1 DUF3990 domain-containing protein [Candidatus Enteromonas sp.]